MKSDYIFGVLETILAIAYVLTFILFTVWIIAILISGENLVMVPILLICLQTIFRAAKHYFYIGIINIWKAKDAEQKQI